MPGPKKLSNAEKQRLYRQCRDNDLEKCAEYLESKKNKYHDDIEIGKKSLKTLTDHEKRIQRKQWFRNQRHSRSNNKVAQSLTPPVSPDGNEVAPSSR
jgi:hypothetical protein